MAAYRQRWGNGARICADDVGAKGLPSAFGDDGAERGPGLDVVELILGNHVVRKPVPA